MKRLYFNHPFLLSFLSLFLRGLVVIILFVIFIESIWSPISSDRNFNSLLIWSLLTCIIYAGVSYIYVKFSYKKSILNSVTKNPIRMKNKKIISNWRIALTYVFGMGLIQLVTLPVLFLIFKLLNLEISPNSFYTFSLPLYFVSFIFNILTLWVAAILISLYLNRGYLIKDKKGLLKILVIFLLFSLGYDFWTIYNQLVKFNLERIMIICKIASSIIIVFLEYYLAKRYIKEDTNKII